MKKAHGPAGFFVAALSRTLRQQYAAQPPNTDVLNTPPLATMKKTMGIDSIVLVREARNATRRAFAFSASVAGFMPRIFCWLGQMRTQTLKSMIVPSHAPTP